MANKRPAGKDFNAAGPPKQIHLEGSASFPSITGQQRLVFPVSRAANLVGDSTGVPSVRHTLSPTQRQSPALISFHGMLSSTPSLTVAKATGPFEFPGRVSPSISTPSGIIPLPAQSVTGISTTSHQLAAAAAALGISPLPTAPAGLQTQYLTGTISSGVLATTQTSSLVAQPSLAVASTLLPAAPIPDAPPPPYPALESTNYDEVTCSSPSQFLHSPTKIQSSSPASSQSLHGACKDVEKNTAVVRVDRSNPAKRHLSKNLGVLRTKAVQLRKSKMATSKMRHEKFLLEKFFLEGGGNLMDYHVWCKKPNILRDQFLKQHDLDSDTSVFEDLLSPRYPPQTREKMETDTILEQEAPLDLEPISRQQLFQKRLSKIHTCTVSVSPALVPQTPTSTPLLPTSIPLLPSSTPQSLVLSPSRSLSLSSPRPPIRLHSTLSSVTEVSHEDIVMRARHEAEVMKAIAELRKEGLWSASRLPKVQEPARIKTHWDYLLEEMQWLATDFANEKRWKINAAKKLSRTVVRHHQEREQQQKRAEKDNQLKLRKIASNMAKEVKHFWESIQKVVEHKQQALLEEKRKKAMDIHLNFIVDQTQKYSSWLTQGMSSIPVGSHTPSEPSLISTQSHDGDSDDLFNPMADDDALDDEETIDKEEMIAEKEGEMDYESELKHLRQEGEMPLDDLLASLPPGMLDDRPLTPVKGVSATKDVEKKEAAVEADKGQESSDMASRRSRKRLREESDEEYAATERDSEKEDETTIAEQEDHEKAIDYTSEISALQQEGELPIEDLLQLYNLKRQSATPETDVNEDESDAITATSMDQASVSSEKESSEFFEGNEEEEEELEGSDASVDEEPGLELLVTGKSLKEVCQTEQGLTDVAAAAQQLQPKGITLASTEVKTKVPFLLRHVLREYQHIGLDWLVTMYERHLNGILADEMGLGKTIQTIALLAHLCCERGNWGPHLIVVPTSVMLNWEFEFKKWCPAFKILTYYGSNKERKQKRIGWTKQNAFHVCITSYNLAVQDHRAFKQKKWKYLVLDEAQNIKNFKSQRWQTLLTFNSQHRLLLTGTPLQNNLMELWSLMHFLMPTVFSSHSDFKEWFSNPLTGMVEGSQEYNESIVRRLHQVLRPFLLRRLKMEVEKQMPKKYEHVVVCRLSKRQRFLYEEYMSQTKTKETLATGNYMSVINILMQLRKVCNHPDLFEPRPVVTPLVMTGLLYETASLALTPLTYNPFKHVSLDSLNLDLANYELKMEAFEGFRSRQLQASRALIADLSSTSSLPGLRGDVAAVGTNSKELDDLLLPSLVTARNNWMESRCRQMCEVNIRRCKRQPVYGQDLIRAVKTVYYRDTSSGPLRRSQQSGAERNNWLWSGYVSCHLQQTHTGNQWWMASTYALKDLLLSHEDRVAQLECILKRFLMVVNPVLTQPVSMHVPHPDPSSFQRQREWEQSLQRELSVGRLTDLFHPMATSKCFQFPETRLIQYDCGKLQTLDELLRTLKCDGHRVLIFTQMARMLDVLEIFLNYHGHTYLRLDGATPVQKRQALMERFNRDSRVFCFILSTRSGGLGVNLTGADTVIFYDSDWNPTMDAQAQDRCHRIGQTRDVNIYRLVCASTVEENILKKANQKKILGDIAIESGAFTTDFFKQDSIQDLFQVPSEADGQQTSTKQEKVVPASSTAEQMEQFSQEQLEEMLLEVEEENDVKAAKRAGAEQAAELAEFDESFLQNQASEYEPGGEAESKVMLEFAQIVEQLSGVERYAMRILEAETSEFTAQRLRQAEANIEQAKKEWELSHLQRLREQEERQAREEEEEEAMCLTYDRPEMINKRMVDEETGEEMPMWLPPTPPTDERPEYYVDLALGMWYDTSSTMTPDELGPITVYCDDDYDVFGLWKPPVEISEPTKKSSRSSKFKREHVTVPQSLFWRKYTPDLMSTRIRKLSPQTKKVKARAEQFTPLLDGQDGPDWMCMEEWIMVKGLTSVLEFPLSLMATLPAQMPNWDILSDLTTNLGKMKRSPIQCKEHLVGVVIPREEQTHRLEETDPKKQKYQGLQKKHKSRREQWTKTMVMHDRGKEITKLFSSCFSLIHSAREKRKQQGRPPSVDPSPQTSMHRDLLQKDYGIPTEKVHSPMYLAQQRTKRIQSEMPRSSQVYQLLAQGGSSYSQLSQQYPPGAAVGSYLKQSSNMPASSTATGNDVGQVTAASGYNLAGSAVASSHTATAASPMAQLSHRLQTSAATMPGISSAILPPKSVQSTPMTSLSLASTPSLPTRTLQLPMTTPSSAVPSPVTTPANTTIPSVMPAALSQVSKAYPGVELSKGIIRTGFTQQQLLLLRQQALHQQQQAQLQAQKQQQQQQSPSQVAQQLQKQPHQPIAAAQSPAIIPSVGKQPSVQLSQKLQLSTSIEQLRPAIALQSSRAVPSAATLIKAGLHTRSMQTEEVLALLRQQQSYRLAVTTTKLSQIQQQLAATKASASPHLTLGGEAASQVVTPQLSVPKPSVVAPAESVKLGEQETAQLKVERVDQAQLQKLASQHTLLKKGEKE